MGYGGDTGGIVTVDNTSNSITNDKLDVSTITYEKTNYLMTGKNLYNQDSVTDGYFVNNTNGQLNVNVSYSASDYLPITGGSSYTQNYSYYLAFYDKGKTYISGLSASATPLSPRTITAPANAYYLRITCQIGQKSTMQVELGSSTTNYESYGVKFKKVPTLAPVITLPPTINGLVGKEINIYFRNIVENPDLNNIESSGGLGKQQSDRWTVVPTAVGTTAIVISLYDKQTGVLLGSATTSVVVKDAAVGSGVNKKCLFIGDSTTASGKYTQGLLDLFGVSDPMDITLLGTLGTSPNLHEGRSGWTTDLYVNQSSYLGVSNPFYNSSTSTFDFSYYIVNNPTVPDVVAIHLGINDIFNDTTDSANDTTVSAVLGRFDTIINSIKAYSSSIKVALMLTIPPSYSQDSFGALYGNNQSLWRYKRNYFRFVKAFLAKYKGQEASNTYLVPVNVNLDTVNNMQTEQVAANSRNSTLITRQNNGVHPADSGYYQMSDIIYYWLKSFEV